jgi:hypothetical protein
LRAILIATSAVVKLLQNRLLVVLLVVLLDCPRHHTGVAD